ncbi:hypothetical protein J520_1643 [Acinetobacter sp. 869535]|nr:hypothetical protein J520_1643 [Acinetobacter sp. 869535]
MFLQKLDKVLEKSDRGQMVIAVQSRKALIEWSITKWPHVA